MIRDDETGWVEANIRINSHTLTFAQAMTVRVAVTSFLMQVQDPKTRELLGPIAEGYEAQLISVMRLLHEKEME